MEKNGKIGIFDSGIGGATVLREIIKILPKQDYFYYSDSKNNPYGDKSEEELINICDNIVNDLIKRNCKTIVIACNTASAITVNFLRNKYKQVPIIAIEPAYKMVHDYAYDKNTLVLATKGTIESERFNILFNKYNNHKTLLLPCIGLAEIIEQEKEEKIKKYLKEKLGIYKNKIENVVLGCTHYPLIKKQIIEVLGNVNFFDGAVRLAEHVKYILKENKMEKNGNGKIYFYDSLNSKDKEERFFKIIREK